MRKFSEKSRLTMISNTVTFEQVEQLAVQLSPPEQLKLVAYLSEQLSGLLKTGQPLDMELARQKRETIADVIVISGEEMRQAMELARQKREALADALLAELDAIAEGIEGQFDSAEDIRQIREERANRL
jgi:hypothetical protein